MTIEFNFSLILTLIIYNYYFVIIIIYFKDNEKKKKNWLIPTYSVVLYPLISKPMAFIFHLHLKSPYTYLYFPFDINYRGETIKYNNYHKHYIKINLYNFFYVIYYYKFNFNHPVFFYLIIRSRSEVRLRGGRSV